MKTITSVKNEYIIRLQKLLNKKDRLKDSFKDEKNYIKSYFMKINDYHKVKGIKKDDLWILLPSSYPYTLSTQFHVVTSL